MFERAELYGGLRNGILKFSDVLSIGDGYAHAFKIMVLSVFKQELVFSLQGRQLGKVNQH